MANKDPKRLAELLSLHADGMLNDAQQQELFALLDEDAYAREVYIDQMMLHAAMLHKAGGRGELTPLIDTQMENEDTGRTESILPPLDGLPTPDGLSLSETSPILGFLGSTIQRGFETLPGFVPIMGLVSVLSVVATLVLVAVVPWPSENEPSPVAFTSIEQPSREPSSTVVNKPVRSRQAPATVARITRVVNAKWSERSWRWRTVR